MQRVMGVRSMDAEVRSLHDLQGCTELWSTCVVKSRRPLEVRAFLYAIGGDVPGTDRDLKSDKTDTNLRVAGQCMDEGRMITGLEWSIPEVVSPRYLPKQDLAPYHVRLSDVSEFARKSNVRLMLGGDKPFVDVHPGSRPISWDGNGARQAVRFDHAVPICRIERFWAEISFPGDPPIFGKHPEDQAWEASLPVTFRLLEDLGPSAKTAGVLETASGIVSDLRALVEEVNKRLPPHGVDQAVLAEIAEMRKDCGTDAELADLLRAVRQGIRTR